MSEIIVGASRRYPASDALMQALRDPFVESDIEWRVQSSGKATRGPWVRVLAYITNRAIMERLDAVCGVDGWRNEFTHATSGAVLCGLSIKIAEEWITKWDGANETDIEKAKGGLSNAMKRAAVQWGIGRYLYNLEEGYAEITTARHGNYLKANPQKHGDALLWLPPKLPAWALPGGSGSPDVLHAPQTPKAVAVKTDTHAARGAHHAVVVPGTKAHFHGYGGKRIVDIPTDELVQIKDFFTAEPSRVEQYKAVIDAIDLMLDERTQPGA